jgi:hypothetical protein
MARPGHSSPNERPIRDQPVNVLDSACVSFVGQRGGLLQVGGGGGCQQPSNTILVRENENTSCDCPLSAARWA